MTKLKTYVKLAAMGILFVAIASCSKELSEDPTNITITEKRSINTTATIPQIGDKAYFDETDGRKVKWELSDAINIMGTLVPLSSLDADGTTAFFSSSSVNTIVDNGYDVYWAVYPPTLEGTGTSFISEHLWLPDTQVCDIFQDPLKGYAFMAGYARVPTGQTNFHLQMKNVCALMKINLQPKAGNTSNRVDSVVFTSNSPLTGGWTLHTDGEIEPSACTNKLVVKFTNTSNIKYIDITGGVPVYVLLPPMTNAYLNVKIYGDGRRYTEKCIQSATLARNNFYTSTIQVGFEGPHNISVSPTNKVFFAPGNLQWHATGYTYGEWRFAENQYDFVGNSTKGNVYANSVKCDNTQINVSYPGWIDLFCWATSEFNGYHPYMSSDQSGDYYSGSSDISGTDYDWGKYNQIYNPKTRTEQAANTWRTLTHDEWDYLLNTRTTTSGIRYAKATVNGVYGLLILPDDWSTSIHSLNSTNTPSANYTANIIVSSTWKAMEEAGCVFLPITLLRLGTNIDDHDYAYYWSSSAYGNNNAHGIHFTDSDLSHITYLRYFGHAVRLVRDAN